MNTTATLAPAPTWQVWLHRVAATGAAILMLQSLFFKFSGAEESIYIFTKVGMEPWGRYGTGMGELIASILILIPRTTWVGAGLALGIISGAIASHLTVLGIEVMGDGGQLFFYALIIALASLIILVLSAGRIRQFITTRQL